VTLAFHKYEGLGNDFVVVDAANPDALTPEH
jgi:diaminopimelate epimerase